MTPAPGPLFLDGSPAAHEALRAAVAEVLAVLAATDDRGPFPSAGAARLRETATAIEPLPDDAEPLGEVLADVGRTVLAHGARVTDPWCAAHLHPPTLVTAAAAELAIAATNQSMDSYDQAPMATYVEDRLIGRLNQLIGLPATGSGVLTSGGTASNLLGLLLARDHAAGGANLSGLPAGAGRWRILASAGAHVSVRQAAAVLGLGRDAVVAVTTDDDGRMDVAALDRTLGQLTQTGAVPIAVVGTAGTTDTGAVDPLAALADRAAAVGAWFHVDAAVGSALVLSDRLRPLVAGLERADSITADLHKLWWQPIGASALLVRDAAALRSVREPADYLNRTDDDVLNLVDRSLDTSRRFDALKILVSLRATGRRRLAGLVEHLVDLAAKAGEAVRRHPDLELLAPPQTVTVLFRCRPDGVDEDRLDGLNVDVQRRLLASGRAVVGRTRYRGRVALKLTFTNPLTNHDDVAALLAAVAAEASAGLEEAAEEAHAAPTATRGRRSRRVVGRDRKPNGAREASLHGPID
ncbi:aspartate aminotransferase family protein [Jiangella aurantiaca]|uniref:Aspartate aminotransferase family protein n=1 Tax=Jiangella aurantiaca TaxID=2530373 RepID=A0A4R5ABR6_9ACTN|nr:pyridoxal-dependent decarboxylase [Jiangella aurantiaca]TDD68646.1 aspartate aminotransferase family protein [Jiangella aurantiaca]